MFPARYIVCSAILTKKDGKVHVGKRHSNCFQLMRDLGYDKADTVESNAVQWFVTNQKHYGGFRFVDREEAYQIAVEAGQVPDDKKYKSLYSEDIY